MLPCTPASFRVEFERAVVNETWAVRFLDDTGGWDVKYFSSRDPAADFAYRYRDLSAQFWQVLESESRPE